MTNVCGFCSVTFETDGLEARDACPVCGAGFTTRHIANETVVRWAGELQEPWLFRVTVSRLIGIGGIEELGVMMVELQRAFHLEPGVDLSACLMEAGAPQLAAAFVRHHDGTLKPRDLRSVREGQMMMLRDGRGVFYTPSCAAALLLGWRAGVGDA